VKDRWTHQDEAELQRLTKRKAETIAKNMKPLDALAKKLNTSSDESLAESLAEHADELRDALEPFDSGIRCVAEAPQLAA
jgi:hypothetical protein